MSLLKVDKLFRVRSAGLGVLVPLAVLLSSLCVPGSRANAQSAQEEEGHEGVLYTVATAHLDTQWRWTIQQTIGEFIKATLEDNFALLEAYPNYTFNFEGSFRYELMKEYYPQEFERVRDYIAAGRWHVSGSWVDAVDTNVPSPEALIRQVLYGNGYFRREFGKTSRDIFLPDCFGFGYALPTVAAHCGLYAFSTQKLTWGSAVGIPFEIGLWQGLDGSGLISAVNPGAYVSDLDGDQSRDSVWVARAEICRQASGLPLAYRYYGTGDTGGGPTEESVQWLERSLQSDGPLEVRSSSSDQLARDLVEGLPADLSRGLRPELMSSLSGAPGMQKLQGLPVYRGELLMTDHGAGCYTSQSAMKRWNRQNERLGNAAERLSVIATWLGGADYPRETLREAWVRFLWHQFHDDLTGTSIPEAYVFSWNDEILSLNQFAEVVTDAAGVVSRALDTNVVGTPLVVYNPLAAPREDIVSGEIQYSREESPPEHVRVYDEKGEEVPSQVISRIDHGLEIAFLARIPSIGIVVYDVRPAESPCEMSTDLSVSTHHLENWRYRVELDENGDIASIFDKRVQRDALSAPLQLQLLEDSPRDWAAWEVDYDDVMAPPKALVKGPAEIRVTENGPARVAIEVIRRSGESTFRQEMSLATGAAGVVFPIAVEIDWRERGTLLKASFPLSVPRETATYDLGMGAIERGANRPDLYEVPAQHWADQTTAQRDFGVAVLSDCRSGWDKPDSHTVRLTLLHTPSVNERWGWIADENTQDLGRHRLRYGIYAHRGNWQYSNVHWVADGFGQPPIAFQARRHGGFAGRNLSLVKVRTAGGDAVPQVAVTALKMAEDSGEIVIRLQERAGRGARDVLVQFVHPLIAAREVNGAEEPVEKEAEIVDGLLCVSLAPFEPRTFALRLGEAPLHIKSFPAAILTLPFDLDGVSCDSDRTDGDFSGEGHTLSGDLFPASLTRGGVPFQLGSAEPGKKNLLTGKGQRLELPEGDFDQLCLLAASTREDHEVRILVDDGEGVGRPVALWMQNYAEPIGQWDNRLRGRELVDDPAQIMPAYIKPQPVGWVGTHRHSPSGENEAYQFTYLFKYVIPLEPGARAIILPEDADLRIAAATALRKQEAQVRPVRPLYDRTRRASVRIEVPRLDFVDRTVVTLTTPNQGASIYYTVDGTTPTQASPRYGEPLTFDETTTLNARAYAPGLESDYVAAARLTRLEPEPSVQTGPVESGLVCKGYRGAWETLPDFATLEPADRWIAAAVELPKEGLGPEDFGLAFAGYITIPREGLYTFNLWSDDGSRLWIGGREVVNNDGLHGNQPKTVNLALGKGKHEIRVEFFQHLGGKALELEVEGPETERQPVPAGWLFH